MLCVVLGKRGQGKSTWIKNTLPALPSFLLYDTLGEHQGANYFNRPEEVLKYFGNFPDYGAPGYKAIFRPRGIAWRDAEPMEWCCRFSYALGNLALIIEEVDAFTGANMYPRALGDMINFGRHRNVDLIVSARRAALVPRLLTSQASDFVLFNMTEVRDIKWVGETLGESMDRLRDLQRGQFLRWTSGEITQGETSPQ